MGLYITAHDDMVMGDQAAVHKSKAISKIESRGNEENKRTQMVQVRMHPVTEELILFNH